MNFERLIIVALFAVLGAMGFQQPATDFAVKDSRGRTRIATQEDGDAFALTLLDGTGRPRMVLRTEIDGRPTVLLMEGDGSHCAMIGKDADGVWSMGVRDPKGCVTRMIARPGHESGLVISRATGEYVASLQCFAERDESVLAIGSPSEPSKRQAMMWASGKGSAGLCIEKGGDRVAGIAESDDARVFWLGDSPLDGSSSGRGVRASYAQATGSRIALKAEAAHDLDVQTTKDGGAGVRIGGKASVAQIGVSNEGIAKLRLVGSKGKAEETVSK
jgi:hypothetical protein